MIYTIEKKKYGVVEVEADSEDEAIAKAMDMVDYEFDWADQFHDDFRVTDVTQNNGDKEEAVIVW